MEPERPSLTMPEELTRRAVAVATGDDGWQVQPARDAATVVLLRDGAAGVEVFLQRRVGRMAFALASTCSRVVGSRTQMRPLPGGGPPVNRSRSHRVPG